MAIPINTEKLLKGKVVESERIEYKKGWNPIPVLHTICAFANDINNWGGGYIIIGVEEKNGAPVFPPIGLTPEEIDKIQKNLIRKTSYIEPKCVFIPQPEQFQNKNILIIWIPGGDERPYKVPDSFDEKKITKYYYIRKGSSTVKAKGIDEKRLLELSVKIPFDDRINHQVSIDDLSLSAIQTFLKEIKSKLYEESMKLSFQELCERMQIIRGPSEYKRPVNAGLLLFSENPEKYFRGACIEVIIYHDDIGDSFSEKKFTGSLFIQLKDALHYIKANVIKEEVRKIENQAKALRFYNYPFSAIEEALANAVYHKDYDHQSTIEVNIRLDRIEVLSFKGPLPPVDNKMLKKKSIISRDYKNRRIGDFLKELELTEGRGTGFPKIYNAMKNNGSPKPIFNTDKDRISFLTTLKIHPQIQSVPQVTTQVKAQVVPSLSQVCPKSVPSQELIKILNKAVNPVKLIDLMELLNQTNRTRFRKRYIHPMIDNGLLQLTIPDDLQSSNQKYKITENGLNILKHSNKKKIE